MQLLQPHVPVFCDYLKKSDSMTPHTLSILVAIAAVNPRSLVAYVSNLQTLASNYPIYTEQVTIIISSIGTISEVSLFRFKLY